jgi:lysophospholipase L1-like esterase
MVLMVFFILFFLALLAINGQSLRPWKKIFLGILAFLLLDFGLVWITGVFISSKPANTAFQLHEHIQPTALNPSYLEFDGVFGQHSNAFNRQTNQEEDWRETANLLICCYGGSSTYCINLNEKDSWPAQLERKLRARGYSVEVHNHGIPGHGFNDNLHNRIFYRCDTLDYKQHLEIHYHGWNDFRRINAPGIEPEITALQQWHAKTNRLMTGLDKIQPGSIAYNYYYMNLISEKTARRLNFLEERTIFLSTLLMKVHSLLHDPIQDSIQEQALGVEANQDFSEKLVIDQLHQNIATLQQADQPTLFIPQLMNFELIREKERSFKYWTPGITEQRMLTYCEVLSAHCQENLPAKAYLTTQTTSWTKDYFLDSGHFSAQGCRQFADNIVHHLLEHQLIR